MMRLSVGGQGIVWLVMILADTRERKEGRKDGWISFYDLWNKARDGPPQTTLK